MSRITALTEVDERLVNETIDTIIRGCPSVQNTEVTRRLVASLQAKARRNDKQAQRTLIALAVDGARSRVETRVKVERTNVQVSQSGASTSISARVGHRRRKKNGQAEKVYQQTLWFELPWVELEDVMRFRRNQRDALTVSIVAYEEILALHDLYPHTKTPLEACDLHGIDPRNFELNDRAVA